MFKYVVVLTCLVFSGCSDGTLTTHKVSGVVNFQGKPAKNIQITFYGRDEEHKNEQAPTPTGVSQDDGSFSVSSYSSGDGAPAGNYSVCISWPVDLPQNEDPEEAELAYDRLLGRYSDPNSPLMEYQVKVGVNDMGIIEVPRK